VRPVVTAARADGAVRLLVLRQLGEACFLGGELGGPFKKAGRGLLHGHQAIIMNMDDYAVLVEAC